MCFSTEGKYIVEGLDVYLHSEKEVPIEILKKLEESPMSQLDAFYIRRRLHSIVRVYDQRHVELNDKIINMKKNIEVFTSHEINCQVDKVPIIAAGVVHKIVNGKFDKIGEALTDIAETQNKTHLTLDNYKAEQESKHLEIMAMIQKTIDKTIFGWFKKQYEAHPIRIVLITAASGVFFFLFLMATFHISSFGQMFDGLLSWFK